MPPLHYLPISLVHYITDNVICTHYYVCSWVTPAFHGGVGLCTYTRTYTHTQLVHMCTPDDSYHSMIWHGSPFPRDRDVMVFAVESITKCFSHLNISRERKEDYCYVTRLILSSSKLLKLQRYKQHMRSENSSYVMHSLLEMCTMKAMLCIVIFQVCKYSQVACWQVPTMSAGVECSFFQTNAFQIFTPILL